jgi:isocitrate dehydrogenase kinase/phosphatase
LKISKYAQALLDPETLEHDPFYSQLQEQWLSFTDTLTGSLDEEEAELFNAVVMSFLEYQGLDQQDLGIMDLKQNIREENLRKPVWQRYKESMFTMEQLFTNY